MASTKLKIVIWCGPGANQKALANKIAKAFNVVGIVNDDHSGITKKSAKRNFLSAIIDRLQFGKIYKAWKDLLHEYDRQFPSWPNTAFLKVSNINNIETRSFTEKLLPDLIIVSGTSLIKKDLFAIPLSKGIINLHTGLSPYVKGGPNCTNWCIANNEFHLVGNTIMWLNEGIDSGNIIATETVNIQKANNLPAAHKIVMEHAHDLYIRSIRYIEAMTMYNSVPQNTIDKGKLYLTKMWTKEKKKQLLANWKKRASFVAPFSPKTISLGT